MRGDGCPGGHGRRDSLGAGRRGDRRGRCGARWRGRCGGRSGRGRGGGRVRGRRLGRVDERGGRWFRGRVRGSAWWVERGRRPGHVLGDMCVAGGERGRRWGRGRVGGCGGSVSRWLARGGRGGSGAWGFEPGCEVRSKGCDDSWQVGGGQARAWRVGRLASVAVVDDDPVGERGGRGGGACVGRGRGGGARSGWWGGRVCFGCRRGGRACADARGCRGRRGGGWFDRRRLCLNDRSDRFGDGRGWARVDDRQRLRGAFRRAVPLLGPGGEQGQAQLGPGAAGDELADEGGLFVAREQGRPQQVADEALAYAVLPAGVHQNRLSLPVARRAIARA